MQRNLLLTLLVTGLFAFPGPSSLAYAEAEIGQPAPSLVAPELDGTAFDLGTLKGKIVIVHFWATWCPSCREEMGILDAFYRKNHTRGVEVIAPSVDKSRKRDEVRDVMKSVAFPATLLDDATVNDFGKPSAIPVTYIIDGKGILRARLTPDQQAITENELSDVVQPLIGKAD
jgi:peroxiredoxin